MSVIPKNGYWLYKMSPNVYKVGINSSIFKTEYSNILVEHTYLDLKLNKKKINEDTYIGCLMNRHNEAIHISSPLKGFVVDINKQLFYSEVFLKEFIDKKNWLFSLRIEDK